MRRLVSPGKLVAVFDVPWIPQRRETVNTSVAPEDYQGTTCRLMCVLV